MSQITADAAGAAADAPIPDHPALTEENINLASGRVALLWKALVAAGVVGIAASIVACVIVAQSHSVSSAIAHTKGALFVGVVAVLGPSLGALFFLMINYVVNAGWMIAMKRVLEQVALLIWLPAIGVLLFVLSELVSAMSGGTGIVSTWLNDAITAEEYFITKKKPYFNPFFVGARLVFYLVVWIGLARLLWGISRRLEASGDRWLNNKASFHSAWGLLVLALATAFFAFDWLMALTDYEFFSTMWGVYFFAGAFFVTFPAMALLLTFLRSKGTLVGLVTEEHHHDLSKFMFGFVVFWAYIAYSQYFLIWYSAIPEETVWYIHRKQEWPVLTAFLVIGHFIVPFFPLLWRVFRRNTILYCGIGGWLVLMHVLDIYWIIRPALTIAREDPVGFAPGLLVDIPAIAGVVLLYTGVLVWRLTKAPLLNVREPRLPETLVHKNYV
ncbi:MAG: hypothetical protein AAFX79_13180 [Planctomycetota bacterium]